MDWDLLYKKAREARDHAYAPYSRFRVGAALLTREGEIFTGCNVENRSFGLSICAERTALAAAVASGRRDFVAVAVVTDTSPAAVPCGMCRESLTEFAPQLLVLAANLDGERREYSLAELFPTPFEWPGSTGAE